MRILTKYWVKMSTPDPIPDVDQSESESIFKVLWPYLLGTVLVTASLVILVLKLTGNLNQATNPDITIGGSPVVVFDVIKLANSQRSVASSFLGGNSDKAMDASILLTNVNKKVADVIVSVAGKSTVVLVKQSIVYSPDVPDITNAVLEKLGLPTNVPTAGSDSFLQNIAPTDFSFGSIGAQQMEQLKASRTKQAPTSDSSNTVLP